MPIVYAVVGDIITASMLELGLLRPDELPTPNQMVVGVSRFNLLLDEWSLGKNDIFDQATDPFTLQVGVNGYTIGSGAVWDTVRPVEITQAYLTIAGANYPIDVTMTEEEYNKNPIPSQQSQPTRLWYETSYPFGKIWFDFVPDQAYSITLFSSKPFTKATDQYTALAYPDGYEAALVYNLAVRLAPMFGKQVSQTTVALAIKALSDLEIENAVNKWQPAQFNDVPGKKGGRDNVYDMGYPNEP